jgi:hypothetical protein
MWVAGRSATWILTLTRLIVTKKHIWTPFAVMGELPPFSLTYLILKFTVSCPLDVSSRTLFEYEGG